MHIPDGYLSPGTYFSFYAIMVPIWYRASRILNRTLKARHASYLALCAAFSFVIMMFNIPTPGGSTGHCVGATVAAILLGPWAALMAISVVLIIQALLFGDGGVTAFAANCFNMAFVMPFSGYYIYKLLGSRSNISSPRAIFAAGIAGYLSLNLSAFFTAVEFGIQPLIAHAADGTPLYAPYPLSIAVPVMAFEHLVFFGVVEAAVTGLVVAYIAKTEPSLLGHFGVVPRPPAGQSLARARKLWAAIAVLILLTPLGLIASGSAWGEWTSGELHALLGFVPENLKRLEELWPSLMAGYNLPGWSSPAMSAFGYILAAASGVSVILVVAYVVSRLLSSEERSG